MEDYSAISKEDEHMELPPGFRFHPTDEELITHYLSHKVLDSNFCAVAIGEADLNKIEPWDLPREAKMGEKEWYFFCVRDRKYPTGLRTNRATEAGYWKATGKDKEIYRAKALVGMKKTLVFYTGRAPKGEKTNWVMHEFRLEGQYSEYNLAKSAKQNEWVISRVFKKNSGAKKPNVHGLVSPKELHTPFLPPLMDVSPYNNHIETKVMSTHPSHVTCFSNPSVVENQQNITTTTTHEETAMVDTFAAATATPTVTNMLMEQDISDFQFMDSLFTQDQSMLRLLIEGKGSSLMSSSFKTEFPTDMSSSFPNHEIMVNNRVSPSDLDCLWGC